MDEINRMGNMYIFQAAVRFEMEVMTIENEVGKYIDYIVFEYKPSMKERGWRIHDRVFESDEYFNSI